MLRISKKGDYAMFIMGYLARHAGKDVVSAQEIAGHAGLHKSVVANLLKDLTNAGLLESVRGTHGGYRLALPPEEISLGRILRVVEGPFVLVDCAQHTSAGVGDAAAPCSLMSFCPSMRPMQILHERIARLMDELRLPELISPRPAALPRFLPTPAVSHTR